MRADPDRSAFCSWPNARGRSVTETGEWREVWTGLDDGMAGGDPPIAHVIAEVFRIDYMLAAA